MYILIKAHERWEHLWGNTSFSAEKLIQYYERKGIDLSLPPWKGALIVRRNCPEVDRLNQEWLYQYKSLGNWRDQPSLCAAVQLAGMYDKICHLSIRTLRHFNHV